MGTKGYVAFKYKGIYYIFYNHSDSYPSHLGNIMIDDIKKMINENYLEAVKKKIMKIPLQDGDFDGKDNHYQGMIESINYPTCFCYHTSEEEPTNTIFIEYVYIIDFDSEILVIKMENLEVQFDIFDLPPNLIEIVEKHQTQKGYYDNNYEIFRYHQKDNQSEDEEDVEYNEDEEEDVEYNEDDSKETTLLKIKILENQNKINKMKLSLLTKE
jgi:hypothetical protein